MQKVRIYYDIREAKNDMELHIQNGWRVHTCAVGGRQYSDSVLVVYEK